MALKTYFQLEKIVSPVLKNFHDDLKVSDYRTLTKFDVPFVYGYRRTGTNMLLMLPRLNDYSRKSTKTIEELEQKLEEDFIWIDFPNRNTHFLYFDGLKFHRKESYELRKIWFDHVRKIALEARAHGIS